MQSLFKIGIVLAVVTFLVACNPLREISNIRVTVTSESKVTGVPLGTAGELNTLGFDGFAFTVTDREAFQNSDATRDNLESSSLRSFTLRIKASEDSDQDLNFIDEMRVSIDAEGEESQEISNYLEFEEKDKEVTFNVVEGVDLTPYFTAEEAELSVTTSGQPPESDTTLEIEMVFNINFLI